MKLFILFLFVSAVFNSCRPKSQNQQTHPSVIFILTDDQGYGDLGCHGNDVIQTPQLDKLYEESIRFTNYHCGTTCAPTRAGIMTGRHNDRVGVWHTVMGRYLLDKEEVTLADAFANAGYTTGMFGKWHLGDNYPYHPNHRGFDVAVTHGGGGIGQTPDYWNNDYFDDTYFVNRHPEKFSGYCTDVWFQEALKFIEANKDNPFFCYISTNAPHGPYYVPQEYREMYLGKENIPHADSHGPNFYGMITNIDDNIGLLREKLKELGLEKEVILVFSTDNGTSAGVELDRNGFKNGNGYNAGMRGLKGSKYEGGHRVPLFVKWDDGSIGGGKDVDALVSFTDIMPTLLDLCNIPYAENASLDGVSLKPLLTEKKWEHHNRVIITDTQRELHLKKWKDCSVMSGRWRLIDGKELYDIQKDPGQKNDVSAQHPEVVNSLRKEYEKWWEEIDREDDEYSGFIAGNVAENPLQFTSHDWYNEDLPPWHQTHVRNGVVKNGFWMVDFEKAGNYEIQLRRWPVETGLALNASVPSVESMEGVGDLPQGKSISFENARLKVGENGWETSVNPNDQAITFQVELPAGKQKMQTWLTDDKGDVRGAYYVSIEYK